MFKDATISFDSLLLFANDHVAKLKNNNADNLYQTILIDIESILALVEKSINEKKITKNSEIELRNILTLQLTKNALFIAYNNVANEKVIDNFFRITLLHNRQKKHTTKCIAFAFSSTEAIKLNYASNKRLRIMNKGKVTITAQMTLNGETVGNAFKIIPRKIIDKTFTDFCNNANAIQILNPYSTECLCLVQVLE